MLRVAAPRREGNCNFFFHWIPKQLCSPVYQKTVAVYKEFNVKRHEQTKHVNAYEKLPGSDPAEKVKQLKAVLAS